MTLHIPTHTTFNTPLKCTLGLSAINHHCHLYQVCKKHNVYPKRDYMYFHHAQDIARLLMYLQHNTKCMSRVDEKVLCKER